MAPSVSINLSPEQQDELLHIARCSIETGLSRGQALDVGPQGLSEAMIEKRGVFVTLTQEGTLRGCIGSMDSPTPLAQGVAGAAYSAAFQDPRFPPLGEEELDGIRLEISVLSQMEPMITQSRESLLEQINPGVDGLLLEDGRHRSTFLPKVWEQIPEQRQFLGRLLLKAGLPENHWSPSIRFHRYTTLSFSEDFPP